VFEILAVAAAVLAIAALVLVIDLRARTNRLDVTVSGGFAERRQSDADVLAARQAVQVELDNLRRELDVLGHEVAQLKAAVEVPPAPPLPKSRHGRLDDLRQQLRASHLEPEIGDDV
jgi:hypothetical protein